MPISKEVVAVNIEDEMRSSYLDYAMSVIVGRALPDVRDGLKPVHRRILYAMYREDLLSSRRYSKCAGVVGEVLKKYHPHGDSAVYDSLVRMAQEWNMRYPLIDGQGNFGCFTGDTKIRLADGTSRSFIELIEDEEKGKTHFTYSIKDGGQMAMAPIRAPRLTKRDASIVCVTLDNGERIRCTPDHRFMLRDGAYCEAQNLKEGGSLMPFYSRLYAGKDPNLQGYEEVYDPADDRWVFAHHLADADNLSCGRYSTKAGRVRHHQDFNKWNNDPRNILRMGWGEHRLVHQQHLKEMWGEPEFREKMRKVLATLWKDPAFRKKTIQAIGVENRNRWSQMAFRGKQREAKQRLWSDPEFRERILRESMMANVLLNGTPEQKEAVKKAQKNWLKKMWSMPAYVKSQKERMRLLSARIWSDPAHRQKISAISKRRLSTPEAIQKAGEWARKQWSDPAYRVFRSGVSRRQWQDPSYRAKFAGHLERNGQKTTQSRFLTICKRALENTGDLTEGSYEQARKASQVKGILRFEQGIQRYFNGNPGALKMASQSHHGRLNHQVVSVEPAGFADVYDLTVDETHNFSLAAGVLVHNSIDGDSAAAYRYTECRLTALAEEMMADIDKETVGFTPNFDDSSTEPTVLPSRVPNLLLNGSEGIAVGMATKIPPHNLREIVDALIALIHNPDLTIDDLNKLVPGPDFPTGGFVYGVGGIRQAYETGRGIIQMRAKHHFEKIGKGEREAIVITEVPFQVNKARLIESIADLVGEERIEGIGEIRDESDREGLRVVIEIKKGFDTEVILKQLFKHTTLQSSFGIIMLVITGGQPRVVSLKEALRLFIEHRKEVVTRRTDFELREAIKRAHLLEGLKIAVENIDAVVALIKKSPNPPEAKKNLMAQFTLSPEQAQAILDLRLQRLTSLERDKIIEEYAEILKLIARLKEILSSEELVFKIIESELSELKQKFGDERRTQIVAASIENFSVEDLIQEEDMVVTVTHMGYIKRSPIDFYRAQHRGGRGKIGVAMREEDFVEDLFVASTLSYILIFTNFGKVHWLKVHEIPEAGRTAKGKAISNLISLEENEKIATLLPVTKFDQGGGVIFVTRKGVIKKTELAAYSHPRSGGIIALNIEEGDELIEVRLSDGRDILISTREGQTIRFKDTDVRPMGRTATGVWGIRMAGEDIVVGMTLVSEGATLLTVAENGYGKRTETGEYRLQGRGGSGVITMKTTDKTGFVLDTVQVIDADDLMLVTNMGKIIRLHVNQISVMGRNTQGVRLIQMEPGEKVVSVTKLAEKEDEEEGKKGEPTPAPTL